MPEDSAVFKILVADDPSKPPTTTQAPPAPPIVAAVPAPPPAAAATLPPLSQIFPNMPWLHGQPPQQAAAPANQAQAVQTAAPVQAIQAAATAITKQMPAAATAVQAAAAGGAAPQAAAAAAGLGPAAAGGIAGLVATAVVQGFRELRAFVAQNAQIIGATAAGTEAGGALATTGIVVRALEHIPGPLGKVVKEVTSTLEVVGSTLQAYSIQAAKNIQVLGLVAARVAQNDLMGARAIQLQKEIEEKEAVPILGKIVSWWQGLREKQAAIQAFQVARASTTQEAERLARFSPDIMAANAEARIAKFQADYTTARRLGPSYAGFIRTQSDFEVGQQMALTKIKEQNNEQLQHALRQGASTERLTELMAKMKDDTALLASIRSDGAKNKEFNANVAKYMKEAARRRERHGDHFGIDMLKRFFDGIELLPKDVKHDPVMEGWAAQQALIPFGG